MWNGCCPTMRHGHCWVWLGTSPPRSSLRRCRTWRSARSSREAAYRLLGKTGLLTLPFPEQYGGGGQPYEVYLQVLEEIATAWPSVGVGVSVHALTATVVEANGTEAQRDEWLPRMLSGDWLGAYCLSEPQAGSDVSGIRTKAVREGDEYVISGIKQWISNGSHADYYILFARTERRAEARPLGVHRPGRHARHDLRPAREEARPALRHHHAGDVRRCPDPGGQPDRRGGRRHARRALRARRRPARHRGRARPASPRRAWPMPSRTPASASSSAS